MAIPGETMAALKAPIRQSLGAMFHGLALLLVVLPCVARSQVVGIYADSLASSCNLTVPYPGPPVDAYIVFVPGPLADSIGGATFHVTGLPEGWTADVFPNPDADQLIGSPWDGAGIEFPSCRSNVVLYRLRIHPTSAVVGYELLLGRGLSPHLLVCPQAFGCDGHPGTPLPEAHAIINGTTTCIATPSTLCPWTDVEEFPSAPVDLTLAPNPLTSRVSIRYRLAPGTRSVHIAVYDLHGRLVTSLARSSAGISERAAVWDGRDRFGDPVGAGLYVVRLQTENRTIAAKLVVVR